MVRKVGIVIVSYNAFPAVRATLASLRIAKNQASTRVVLVDNASSEIERTKISSFFARCAGEDSSSMWDYIQLGQNLGFAGGYNTGIKFLLDDPGITDICLLNSDVIVTDFWLDRLLATPCDIVSPVTNRAESEQWVPVDYSITLERAFDEKEQTISEFALSQVETFANKRFKGWNGYRVEGEATFFCVVCTREVFERVGLLDETFFPGGYEDDDFCIRARKAGYKIYLARDVFIHHWGSASFSKLQYDYFNENAARNKRYLEEKHSITRHRRPEKPFESYLLDMSFLDSSLGDKEIQRAMNRLFVEQLGEILIHYEKEFHNLGKDARNLGGMPQSLSTQVEQMASSGNLGDVWHKIVGHIDLVLSGKAKLETIRAEFEKFLKAVREKVDCNFALHEFATSRRKSQDAARQPGNFFSVLARNVKKAVHLLVKGVPLLFNFKGIVFFGGYPYLERQSDGYFQRIKSIDRLFSDIWRIYVETGVVPGASAWPERPEHKVIVIHVNSGRVTKALSRIMLMILLLRCRQIYFHSILPMRRNVVSVLMKLPFVFKVVDIHGVVPEEFRLVGDPDSALAYDRVEKLAVQKSNLLIVVSQEMEKHLREKHGENISGKIVLLPILPEIQPEISPRPYVSGKPICVYAGGIQKWQQIDKMLDAIEKTLDLCSYQIYCPTPEKVRGMLSPLAASNIICEHKTQSELYKIYPTCHFGFILREANIVNRVACPTKLVEYLAMGIIPIVDTELIGDFKSLGARFLALDDLLQGKLPDETQRVQMAHENVKVYQALRETYKRGAHEVHHYLSK